MSLAEQAEEFEDPLLSTRLFPLSQRRQGLDVLGVETAGWYLIDGVAEKLPGGVEEKIGLDDVGG